LENRDIRGSSGNPGAAPGTTPETAAGTGAIIKTTIERGDAYLSPQLYNVEITLLETLRGQSSAERLRGQNISAKSPQAGFEFILAKLRLGYFRRVRGLEDEIYKLTEGQFMAVSPDGKTEYPLPPVVIQPQPPLIEVTFNPGDTCEGWILLQVPAAEKQPLLVFKRQHVEGAYGIWGYIWFKMY
jgi:hypothetical protein